MFYKHVYFKAKINIIISGLLFSSLIQSVNAAEFKRYDEVEYVVAQNLVGFTALLNRAKTQTVRLALFGDSQETAPNGAGRIYMPRLNYEFYRRYGNVPETTIEPVGGGEASWLSSAALGSGGPVARRLTPDMILPDQRTAGLYSTARRGALAALYPRGQNFAGLTAGVQLTDHAEFFNMDGIIKAEVIALTHPDSAEIYYRVKPTSKTPRISYTEFVTADGTIDLDLQSESLTYKSGKTAALDFAGKPVLQVEFNSTDSRKLTDLIATRFVNETYPAGITVSDFSKGGTSLSFFLNKNINSGAMLKAFAFDAAIIHFGTNDSKQKSASEFKAETLEMIQYIRSAYNDQSFKIILMGDPDNETTINQAQYEQYAQYAGAHEEIALADANVMSINTRRIAAEKLGWIRGQLAANDLSNDGVHYTDNGARKLAEVEVDALFSISDIRPIDEIDPIPSPTILIDGNSADWNNVTAYQDTPSENTEPADVETLWYANDTNNIYLAYRNRQPIDLQQSWAWQILIDSDYQSNTGFHLNNTGIDYILQGKSLYKYTGNGEDWNFSYITEVEGAFNGNFAEFSLSRTIIGQSNQFKLYFYGANIYAGGNTNDFFFVNIANNQNDGIVIDGNANDWSQVNAVSDEPEPDTTPVDFQTVWTKQDDNKLFLAYKNRQDIDLNQHWAWLVLIDSDSQISTGINFYNLTGADYLLVGNELYQYIGDGENWQWKFIRVVSSSVNGNFAEFAIDKSDLSNYSSQYKLIFYGSNTYAGGEVDDSVQLFP